MARNSHSELISCWGGSDIFFEASPASMVFLFLCKIILSTSFSFPLNQRINIQKTKRRHGSEGAIFSLVSTNNMLPSATSPDSFFTTATTSGRLLIGCLAKRSRLWASRFLGSASWIFDLAVMLFQYLFFHLMLLYFENY